MDTKNRTVSQPFDFAHGGMRGVHASTRVKPNEMRVMPSIPIAFRVGFIQEITLSHELQERYKRLLNGSAKKPSSLNPAIPRADYRGGI